MTVKEIKTAVAHMKDDDEVKFVIRVYDDCYPDEFSINDVVVYEEPLDYETLDKAINEIKSADTLIIGGTSLLVYPAASLINYFNGKHIILINKEETKSDYKADIVIHDKLGNVFKKIKDAITSL